MKYFRKIFLKFRNRSKFKGENPKKYFHFLMDSQYWSYSDLQNYQLKKFNNLLVAAKEIPFYKSSIDRLGQLVKYDDLKSFPVTNKSDFQNDPDAFFVDKSTRGFVHASSGSTGNPARIVISNSAEVFRAASKMRFRSWWGITPEDKHINFTAYPLSSSSLSKKIKNYLNPKLDLFIFNLDQANIESLYHQVLKYKPVYFRGYVSAIKEFGLLAKAKKLDLKKLKIKLIIVTSEILYDSDKTLLKELFLCPVANEYGCAEMGLIAYECPDGGMHIQEETVLVNTNNANEIISTELHNDKSPLLNYRIGDKIKISDKTCSCKRNLRLIESIEGRIGSDDIIKPDGSRLTYFFFDKMIKNLSDSELWGKIKRFQVIQKGMDFNVKIVKGENYSDEVTSYIEKYIKDGISKDVKVNIIFKESIQPEKSGKYRIFKRID